MRRPSNSKTQRSLRIEHLEARLVLATTVSVADGDWHDGATWDNGVPTDADIGLVAAELRSDGSALPVEGAVAEWNFASLLHVLGDFDRDGVVDGADLAQWEGDYGLNDNSDADDDGDSDGADFLIWQRNLGLSCPPALVSESFDYTIGTKLAGGSANGGTGWAGGWTTTQTALRLDAADTSLWFGNVPGFNQDGTGHIEGADSSSSIRDWSTPIDLGTTDLYFAALVQIPTADTQARFEFYDSPGASGNMRLNVGFNDYDADGKVDLFIDANSTSYPVGAAYASGGINADTTYLLVVKRDKHTVSASLIPGDGATSSLVEPTTWDVSQVGNSGVDLQSMKIASSTGSIRIDELRIGNTFVEAVAGLPVEIETDMLLTSPADGSTVYQTIPYFEWTDVVAHPYLGNYEIQIDDDADFSSLFDQDSIPAMLSWYSPTVEFTRGTTYHWRVRHVDENGTPDVWSAAHTVTIGVPYVVDVLPADGWDEIQSKYEQVADYGAANAQAAELRFPADQVFNLVQDPADDYLLDYPDKGNFIINGRGSTLILQCTQPVEQPLCGFLRLTDQSDVQLTDIIIDYAADSLAQYGGIISNLDKVNGTFTVTVDTSVYANFHEASTVSQGTFAYAETGARIQDLTRYHTVESWADAQQSVGVFNFTFDTTPNPALLAELENGDYFISSPIPDRGGDVIRLSSSGTADNFVANDVTTWASRGRFVAGGVYHTRILNSNFLRTQGRLRGSASGGVNHQVDYAWYENDQFEYTRDDAFHDGGSGAESDSPGQMVIRNSQVIGAYRSSIWVQMDRHWVADNVVRHAGSNGIFIGRSGVTNTMNDQMDVGLIENNVVLGVRGVGVRSGVNLAALPDPVAGYHNQYLTIRNNSVFDTHTDQAFELDYLSNSVVENNRVSSTTSDWSAYSDPSRQIGFHFDESMNITGTGNQVYDARLDPADHLVIEPTSTNITVQVINAVAVLEAPLFIFDPFEQTVASVGVVYVSSLEYDAIDYNGDPLTFTKLLGPAWLNIASDGTLSGTPNPADLGLNSWTVQVSDGFGGMDTATLLIFVDNTVSPSLSAVSEWTEFDEQNFNINWFEFHTAFLSEEA